LFRQHRQAEQCVCRTRQRGNDRTDAVLGVVQEQFRYATKTIGISETAAAELMNMPTTFQAAAFFI
jgi:hypothetical protein